MIFAFVLSSIGKTDLCSDVHVRRVAFSVCLIGIHESISAGDAPFTQQQDLVIADAASASPCRWTSSLPPAPKRPRDCGRRQRAWHSDRGKIRDHRYGQFYDIFCGRGYCVFAVRPGSIDRFDAADMVANIETAIRWVKEHAGTYGIDPAQVGLTGASAGGHLASLTGLKTSRSAEDPARVAAVGVFFPPTDLLDYGGVKADPRGDTRIGKIAARLGFASGTTGLTDEQVDEKLALISPARQVHAGAPPFLLIHGDADPAVPLKQSEVLRDNLKAADVPVELIVKPGGGHPWSTIHEEVAKLADWFDQRLLPAK
ncbi:MAG: alpha/beta hydrolase [Planctomycetaceae bacterium]